MTNDQKIYKYQIEKNYLEVARSIIKNPLTDLYSYKNSSGYDEDVAMNIAFSIVSISCIYSYLVIESFCNVQLHAVFKNINRYNKSNRNEQGWQLGGIDESVCNGKNANWIELETKEKLKLLCKAYKLQNISEVDKPLWNNFCQILRDVRHFLIHPKPDKQTFGDIMKKVMEEHKPKIYVETAVKLIKYFYKKLNKEIPEWLNENTLFAFTGIEVQK